MATIAFVTARRFPEFGGSCMRIRIIGLVAVIHAVSIMHAAYAAAPISVQTESLARLAPHANPAAVALAVSAMHCAVNHGQGVHATRLVLIDYSLPSLQPRLWVFDLEHTKLLYEEYVAHGKGSGENYAQRFSNLDESRATSLGLFLTGDAYEGHNGHSMRLEGLEPGTNDHAMQREIVMHGADYVDPILGKVQGRLGRSWGCPALRREIAAPLIDSIRQGNFVFAYYPDPAWLQHSPWLHCDRR